MKTRILTAGIALSIFLPVLYFADTVAFPLVMAIVAALSGYEMVSAVGLKRNLYISVPAIIYCFTATLIARVDSFLTPTLIKNIPRTFVYVFITLAFLFYLLAVSVFAFDKIKSRDILAVFALTVYSAFSFFCFVMVQSCAKYDYLLILIAAWLSDTFAIFGGMLFGKKKLAPSLSQKKTVAGLICGVIGAIFGFFVYNIIVSLFFGSEVNYALRLLFAIPASIIAQMGDLVASAIKRDFGVKDFGNILPGHGGITDRFDSVMFLSIATFLFISVVKYCIPGLV